MGIESIELHLRTLRSDLALHNLRHQPAVEREFQRERLGNLQRRAFSLPTSQWHHFAITWTNGGSAELYCDGLSVWSASTPNPFTTLTQDLRFGDVDGTGSGFRIDDVQLWGSDFSSQRICEDLMQGSWNGATCELS